MSGDKRALYFWVLQRHSIYGEPELRKVAGGWQAPRIVHSNGHAFGMCSSLRVLACGLPLLRLCLASVRICITFCADWPHVEHRSGDSATNVAPRVHGI